MREERISIGGIPAVVWGEESEKVYLCVHGKLASKEAARGLAEIAAEKGFQTLAFDLPRHGERKDEAARCDVWQGVHDLKLAADYAFARWKHVCLYACSLGAYFSLNAYSDRKFERCLFQSPIPDMEHLIRKMMLWFNVSEERLQCEGEIETPVDTMTWPYYQYVLSHPAEKWPFPTAILYGGRDSLQDESVIRAFAERFGCTLRVARDSDHPFMEEGDLPIVEDWLRENL